DARVPQCPPTGASYQRALPQGSDLPLLHFRSRDGDADLGARDQRQTAAGGLRPQNSQCTPAVCGVNESRSLRPRLKPSVAQARSKAAETAALHDLAELGCATDAAKR